MVTLGAKIYDGRQIVAKCALRKVVFGHVRIQPKTNIEYNQNKKTWHTHDSMRRAPLPSRKARQMDIDVMTHCAKFEVV